MTPDNQPTPHNIDAEEALIGCILLAGTASATNPAIQKCMEAGLKPEAFYKPEHQIIYGVLVEFTEQNEPIDEISLADELKGRLVSSLPGHKFDKVEGRSQLDLIGGEKTIDQLAQRVETAASVDQFIDIVFDNWRRRVMISGATKLVNACHFPDGIELETIYAKFTNAVEENARLGKTRQKYTGQALKDSISSYLAQEKADTTTGGVRTSLTPLDAILGRFRNGDMITIAARPGEGKTAIVMQVIGKYLSLSAERHVLLFSIEMPAPQVGLRIVSQLTELDIRKVGAGYGNQEENDKLSEHVKWLSEVPITIYDEAKITIHQIRAAARREHAKHELALVAVDYLQLITFEGDKRTSREQQVSEMSRNMKQMARELNVPVLVVAQLNRDIEKAKRARKPMLSDLRDSGSIEQDSDVVIFIYSQKEEKIIEVAKQRNGPLGFFPVKWIPEWTLFKNK